MSISSINNDPNYASSTSESQANESGNDSGSGPGLVANGEPNVTISSVEEADDDDSGSSEGDDEYASDIAQTQNFITSGAAAMNAMQSLSQLTSSQSLWNQMKHQGQSEREDSGASISLDAQGGTRLDWTSLDPAQEWISDQNEASSSLNVDTNSMIESLGKVTGQSFQMQNGGLPV